MTIYFLKQQRKKHFSLVNCHYLSRKNILVKFSKPSLLQSAQTSNDKEINIELKHVIVYITKDKKTKVNSVVSENKKYFNLKLDRKLYSTEHSNKITWTLLSMSSLFVILELPYFIAWFCFFCFNIYSPNESENAKSSIVYSITKNHLIGFINLTELTYLLNFSIHFYIYCVSGKLFCNRLKRLFGVK